MKKTKGNILLIVIVFIAVAFLGLSALGHVFLVFNKSIDLEYKKTKAYYLAYSGLNAGQNIFVQVPTLNISIKNPDLRKKRLYQNFSSGYNISNNLDGMISLIKTPDNSLYSLAMIDNKYRAIIYCKYTVEKEKIVFSNIQKL
ncbi:hypothetical protein ACFL2K_01910 [Candidatus Margulisiibacteriota bacterium]